MKRFLLLLLCLLAILSSCGMYQGGFERGGELTSRFLERIQENSKNEEDNLLPQNKDVKKCSKPFRRSARK